MADIEPTSIEEHIAIVNEAKAEADAVPADQVREPNLPVAVFLEENRIMILGVEQHFETFAEAGFTRDMLNKHKTNISALSSAQRLWYTERRAGVSEASVIIIDVAEATREEVMAAATLALRHSTEGQRRINLIREGEGLADLIADLDDSALLITDFRTEFEAINKDPHALSQRAAAASRDLVAVRSEQQVAQSLSGYKALRDRIYSLCLESRDEIKAFAAYVFRNDQNDKRRRLFTSAYLRRKKSRSKGRNTEATAPTQTSDEM